MSTPLTRPEPPLTSPQADRGYSLLEVLVVLAILGLAAGVVIPSLSSGLNSSARHAARLSLEERVLELRRRAIDERQPYCLGAASPEVAAAAECRFATLDLPAGWTYAAEPPLVFYADGTCSGGVMKLAPQNGRGGRDYAIKATTCRPEK